MERGEEHQRQLREEQRSGKWDFGDQPALFAVAQAIVKNDQDAIRAAAQAVPDLQAPGRDGTTLLYFRRDGIVAAPGISRSGQNTAFAGRGPELHQREVELLRDGQRGACVGARSARDAGGGWKSERSRRVRPAHDSDELVFGLLSRSGEIAT